MNVLQSMQSEVREQITRELVEVNWVAFTMDFWTSIAMDSYLGITVHFIKPEWKLGSRVLQTRQMTESHTGMCNSAPHMKSYT